MRILVADDDPVFLKLVTTAIEQRTPHEVIAVSDGKKALEAALGEPRPDMLVLDWLMPEMTGTQVCRLVRAANIPVQPQVLFVTARSRREEILECLAAGADDLLTKPFAPDVLVARVQLALHKDGRGTAPSEGLRQALAKACREGDGELVARSGSMTARVLLSGGKIAWIQHMDGTGSLLDALANEVAIDPDTSREIVAECRRTGAGLSATLADWGLVDRARLRDTMKLWLSKKLASLNALDKPSFLFLPGKHYYSPELLFQLEELTVDDMTPVPLSVRKINSSTSTPTDTRPTLIPAGGWASAFVTAEQSNPEDHLLLERCLGCEAVKGVVMIERLTGQCLGRMGRELDPDIAWAQLEALNAVMKTEQVEDSVVVTDKHLHIMLFVPDRPALVYAVADRDKLTFAGVRLALQQALRS